MRRAPRRAAACALVAAPLVLLLPACESGKSAENARLRQQVETLSARIVALEADNARLQKQIDLMVEANARRNEVLRAQEALEDAPPPK